MDKYAIPEISDGVFSVGSKDWNWRIFDSLIPLPHGTTYNAYLVKGKDGSALIDTVKPGFEGELAEKLRQVMDPADLDYLVMNHAEPDHAGSVANVMEMNDKVTLVATKKGAKMAEIYFGVPEERIRVVGEGDAIDLGGKTLRFIDAPWLHWPETMFTYLPEGRLLFSCDFFGAHTAFGTYDDQVEDLVSIAQKYYGEIMMPFSKMGKSALQKVENLDLDMIAPSHGPVYRNPERIVEAYRKWTAGQMKEKVLVVYVTMWSSTEKMIGTMVETLLSEGVEVRSFHLPVADIGDVAKELVDSRAIVLGMPTVLGGMHPLAIYWAYLVKALRPPLKYGVVLSSYGWGGGALRQAGEILEPTKIEMVGAMEINGPPSADDHRKIVEIGRELARKVKAG